MGRKDNKAKYIFIRNHVDYLMISKTFSNSLNKLILLLSIYYCWAEEKKKAKLWQRHKQVKLSGNGNNE